MENIPPIYQEIPLPTSGRRWVIPDIHGCSQTFQKLVENEIQLQAEDQLFLLGDYIDRGPDSGAVIDYILELQARDFQVFPLKGNHEDMLVEAYDEYELRLLKGLLRLQKCYGMTDQMGEIHPHYLDFMRNLPHYLISGDFYLVHAGFDFKLDDPFGEYKAMLWIRDFEVDEAKLNGRRIVHGHCPHYLEDIQAQIQAQATVIPLDNGCVYRRKRKLLDHTRLGKLCALNLDTMELRTLENVDMPRQ